MDTPEVANELFVLLSAILFIMGARDFDLHVD
jgi:hypothetical protein